MGQTIEAAEYFKDGSPGASIIIDPAWGDNGKGKMVDAASEHVDANARYSGSTNAGHTVYDENGEVFKLHGIPSSIFSPDTLSVIATGVLVNPIALSGEISDLQQRGKIVTPENLLISRGSHLIMPWHIKRDELREEARGKGKIGTTRQGNADAVSDRALRVGLRVGDLEDPVRLQQLLDEELVFQERLAHAIKGDRSRAPIYDRDAILADLLKARAVLLPFAGNAQEVLWRYEDEGKRIMGEGAQGVLLDLDLGNYPFVTSSHPGRAGFEASTGIHKIGRVLAVTKAYATRVGGGPMPTELTDEVGEDLRQRGGEFGATTGRPRRTGWFDGVATEYGARAGGATGIALTKLDIFDGMSSVKLGVGYRIDGVEHRRIYDGDADLFSRAEPIYEEIPWGISVAGITSFEDLPPEALRLIKRIEEVVGLDVEAVSVGPGRNDVMYRRTS